MVALQCRGFDRVFSQAGGLGPGGVEVVFRVEGEKRIKMDESFMPDPQAMALTVLLERVRRLEERINNGNQKRKTGHI